MSDLPFPRGPSAEDIERLFARAGNVAHYVMIRHRAEYSAIISRLVKPPIMQIDYKSGQSEVVTLPLHDREMG